jgi:NodT family efflux transporter outer membrane factor (OMF) lipoprotein
VSLGLSYEIDFWGRIRSQKNAALSQFFATAADTRNTRIAIISQTISTYFQTVTLEQQVELANRNVQLLRDRLAITDERYERGLIPSFELYAVRQQLEQARADQPTLTSQQYDAQSRLAVLLGRYVGNERSLLGETAPDSLALGPIPAGLPSDLLMQRPDVMAAAARLEATRQQIGVARANLLPSLSLTGEGGLQSSDLSSLLDLDQRFSSFIASLTAPLFQGGARWAEVDASKARYRQQLATYENTLLTAFREVKASLVAYQQEQQRYERVQEQRAAAEATAQNQRDRYQRGIGDALALLDAEQNLVQVRQRLATAAQALIEARLAVHRALGGAWTDAPPPEDPRLLQ